MLRRIEGLLEWSVFASRWLMAPVYLGLVGAQIAFAFKFFRDLWTLLTTIWHPGDGHGHGGHDVIALILGLVDMLMVANLVLMVLIGGYATFVSKLNVDDHEDRPEWLDHIDPGTLKTKLAGALVSISGIHLLQAFNQLAALSPTATDINHGRYIWMVVIHVSFIVTTLLLAWSDLIFERKVKLAHAKHEPAAA